MEGVITILMSKISFDHCNSQNQTIRIPRAIFVGHQTFTDINTSYGRDRKAT